MVVRNPTELAEALEAGDHALPPSVETELERSGRPCGKRFGSLVHEVLAEVSFDATAAQVEACSALQGVRLGSSSEEVAAASVAVKAALVHPLLQRAAASPDCRREEGITVVLPTGELVEGIIDLAFFEPDSGWTVVEFKTALGDPETQARYGVQLDCYLRAVAGATGQPVQGTLLLV